MTAISTNRETKAQRDCSPSQTWYVRPRSESQRATTSLSAQPENHQPLSSGHTCHDAAGPQGWIQNVGRGQGRPLGHQDQYVPHRAVFFTQEEFSSSSFLFSILFNIYKTFLTVVGISLPSLIGAQ